MNHLILASNLKRFSTIFLQVVVVIIGVGALAFMLWEPHLEGRNAHATPFEIYFQDPFLAYMYITSIPFFMALCQAFKLLGYVEQDRVFSPVAVKALRMIKRCAIAIIGFVAVGEIFIMLSDTDDRAGGVAIGIVISFGSLVIASVAVMFERILRSAADRQPAPRFD